MIKKLQYLVAFVFSLVLSIQVYDYYQASDLEQNLEARKLRKQSKTQSIKGLIDDEKRVRGLIVPSENGTDFEDKNAVRYPDFHKVKEFEKALANAGKHKSMAVSWAERGPGNFSGRVTSIAVDPNNINNIYVGTAGGGVFKSTNKGTDWTAVTENLPNLTITKVAMSANNSNVIYAGTGDTFANDGVGDGIYKSTNAGTSWTRLLSTENDNFKWVSNIIVNPSNENHLVVATKSGIFYSTNGGSTFSNSSMNGVNVTYLEYKFGDFTTQYSVSYTLSGSDVTASGIYRSTNSGQTWTQATDLSTTRQRMTIAVSESNPATAYVLAEGATDGKGYIYKTTNSGSSWSALSQSGSFQNVFQTHGTNSTGGQGWYDQSLTVNPLNANEIYVGGIDLYRGTVSGTSVSLARITHGYSWSPDAAITPYVHVDQHAAVSVKTGASTYEMFFGNDGGFWRTSNGGSSFFNGTNGLRNVQFYSAQKHPSQYKFAAGAQDNGTFVSGVDPGTSSDWGSFKIGGDGFGVVWNQGNGNLVIGGSQNGNLAKSTNAGSSFGSMSTPWTQAPFVNVIGHSTNNNNRIVYSGSSKIYISNNFGDSWVSRTTARANYLSSRAQNVISNTNADYIWVADAIGKLSSGTLLGVFRSTNGGTSFTETSTPTELQSGAWYVSGFAAHPTDLNTAYLLMGVPGKPHVMRTTNGGSSWSDLTNSNGFPDVTTYCLAVNPNNTSEIWVGTEIGLFISTDNGVSWSYSNNGLPAVVVREITFRGSTVVIATFGRGLFTAEITTTVTVNAPSALNSPSKTSSSVSLSWTDNSNNEDGFKIERALGSGAFSQVATVATNTTSYTSTGLTANTAYRFRVRANNGTTNSSYSNVLSVTTDAATIIVNAPSALNSPSKTSSSVSLNWTDNSNNEDGFKIERALGSGAFSQIATVATNTTSYTNTGLTANTAYRFRVRANNGTTNSSYSNVLSVTTDPSGPDPNNYEPNGNFASAVTIPVNTLISSFIQSNGDEDYFAFTISNAGAISVNLANFPGDYDIFLYNSAQTELGRGYTTNDPEVINYTASAAGTFYVRVDGYQSANSSTDDYQLTINYTASLPAQWYYSAQTIESPHNYSNNYNNTKTYTQAGAQKVAVHFSRLETELNYDYVYIKDAAGTTQGTYHGNVASFWATVDGSKIDINLVTDYSVTAWGYRVDSVAYYASSALAVSGMLQNTRFGDITVETRGSFSQINNTMKSIEIDPLATKQEFNPSIPTDFTVYEAFPNPFNPKTTIRFYLKEQSYVQLEILNTLGQTIKTLLSKELDGNRSHDITWDATNTSNQKVASGVYFYRIINGNNIKVKKLILIK
jgi:hypothetical protein